MWPRLAMLCASVARRPEAGRARGWWHWLCVREPLPPCVGVGETSVWGRGVWCDNVLRPVPLSTPFAAPSQLTDQQQKSYKTVNQADCQPDSHYQLEAVLMQKILIKIYFVYKFTYYFAIILLEWCEPDRVYRFKKRS